MATRDDNRADRKSNMLPLVLGAIGALLLGWFIVTSMRDDGPTRTTTPATNQTDTNRTNSPGTNTTKPQ